MTLITGTLLWHISVADGFTNLKVSKSGKHEISTIAEEDEDVSALENKFEAKEEMKKVEKAKTMDVVVETDLVRFIKAYIHISKKVVRNWI